MGDLIQFVRKIGGRPDTGPRSPDCADGFHLRCIGGWDDEGCGCKCHALRTIRKEVEE